MDTKTQCIFCEKKYSNMLLHVVKTHKKFKCVGCQEYKNVDTCISNLEDKNKGKLCKNSLCRECFT